MVDYPQDRAAVCLQVLVEVHPPAPEAGCQQGLAAVFQLGQVADYRLDLGEVCPLGQVEAYRQVLEVDYLLVQVAVFQLDPVAECLLDRHPTSATFLLGLFLWKNL